MSMIRSYTKSNRDWKKRHEGIVTWGISYGHDASLAAIVQRWNTTSAFDPKWPASEVTTTVRAASHSERFMGIKNFHNLCYDQLDWTLEQHLTPPEIVVETDVHWKNLYRELRYGTLERLREVRDRRYFNRGLIRRFFLDRKLPVPRFVSVGHHLSHAWGGYGTSVRSANTKTLVIVADALGELTTAQAYYNKASVSALTNGDDLTPLAGTHRSYPCSLGLYYSAYTQALGFKPNEEEYQVMALAGMQNPSKIPEMPASLTSRPWDGSYHKGLSREKLEFVHRKNKSYGKRLIAYRAQQVFTSYYMAYVEKCLDTYFNKMKVYPDEIVLSGGCALNCVATSKIGSWLEQTHPDLVLTVYHNAGDAGSSVGAALAFLKSSASDYTPFVGPHPEDIREAYSSRVDTSKFIPEMFVDRLHEKGYVYVHERADEFGPRALGNRSLLANPGVHKLTLDKLKKRQPFRPYGVIILKEHVEDYFHIDAPNFLGRNGPFMNVVLRAKLNAIRKFPAAVHADGTTRVQVVDESWSKHTRVYDILKAWYAITGIPILINTSSNDRGEPK